MLLDLRSPCTLGATREWDLCALTSSGGRPVPGPGTCDLRRTPDRPWGTKAAGVSWTRVFRRERDKYKLAAVEEHKCRCCEDH